jgi:hypothetical protein
MSVLVLASPNAVERVRFCAAATIRDAQMIARNVLDAERGSQFYGRKTTLTMLLNLLDMGIRPLRPAQTPEQILERLHAWAGGQLEGQAIVYANQ